MINKSTLRFLKDLSKNNNRPWFQDHKEVYTVAHENMKDFMAELKAGMDQIDHIESIRMMRIYRDIRFSKDKTPYKKNFGSV